MAQPICPSTAIKSFPVTLASTLQISPVLYNTVKSPINLSFEWASGTDIPTFSDTVSLNSGELYHSSISPTKLIYNNATYSLLSVQLTSAAHSSWLALTTSEATIIDNTEDVVLTFLHEPEIGNNVNKAPMMVILVSPIVRINRIFPSSTFLSGLANSTAQTVSCNSLFPNISNNQYAYYTTCAKSLSPGNDFQNALVVINVQGLLVSNNIMTKILEKYQSPELPPYISSNLLSNFVFESSQPLSTTNFTSKVKVSLGYGNTGATTDSSMLTTPIDNYKCVPLNPETDIDNGALTVDTRNGTILKNSLGIRQAEIDSYNASYTATVPYDILKQYTTYFIIIVFSITFGVIIIYAIISLIGGESEAGTGATRIKMAIAGLLKVPIYVVIAFFCTFIGLFVGISIAWNNNTPTTALVRPSGRPSGSPSG
jgi:hypothetical protein